MATLLLTENIAYAQDSHIPLCVATLDTRKAFDVVDIVSLKRRLFLSNPDTYKDVTSNGKPYKRHTSKQS